MAVAAAAPPRALPERSAINVRLAGLSVLCAATLVAPELLFVWMPIVLGVPHVAQDLRYLLLPLPRRQIVIAAIAIAALVGLKVAGAPARYEAIVVGGWLVGAIVDVKPRLIGLAILAALTIVALPMQFAALALVTHNVVSFVAWIVVARPTWRQAVITLGVIALFAVGLVAAPVEEPFLRAFIFMQGVHYGVWLAWIPAAKPARLHPLVFVVAAGVIAMGTVDATWTRTTYLALASFHIYLELIVLAVMFARRR